MGRCSYFTVFGGISGNSDITIFSPIGAPLILNNPIIGSIANQQNCMVDPSKAITLVDARTIILPPIRRNWDWDRTYLEQTNQLIISELIIVLVNVTSSDSIWWAIDWITWVRAIWICFFGGHSLDGLQCVLQVSPITVTKFCAP